MALSFRFSSQFKIIFLKSSKDVFCEPKNMAGKKHVQFLFKCKAKTSVRLHGKSHFNRIKCQTLKTYHNSHRFCALFGSRTFNALDFFLLLFAGAFPVSALSLLFFVKTLAANVLDKASNTSSFSNLSSLALAQNEFSLILLFLIYK